MNTPKSRLALAVIAATASLAQSNIAVAEDKSYQPTLMNQVTVTATRTEKQLKDVAASVTVVDEEQIEKDLVTDIKDLIKYEPGVNIGSDGRTGSEGYNIRGMDGNRVKIMIDGVDQAQQYDSGYTYLRSQRNSVDVDTLKAVEIVKGPSSTLYGGDAIGGIVAYQTKDPADYLKAEGDDTAASVKATYSSKDEGFTETFSIANRTGDLESMLVYTRRDHKETETHGGADTFGASRGEADPLIDVGQDNILAKVQYQINEDHRAGLTVENYDSRNKSELKSNAASSAEEVATGDDESTRSRVGVFHEWEADSVMFDQLKWTFDWQKTKQDQDTHMPAYDADYGMGFLIPLPERLKEYEYEEDSYQFNAQFEKEIQIDTLDHYFIYGLNATRTDISNINVTKTLSGSNAGDVGEANGIPFAESMKYGVFIQDEIRVSDALSISPGIRFDSYEYKPSKNNSFDYDMADVSDSKVTGHLGAIYDFNDNLSAFGQLSQGFKEPGLYEMYFTRDGGSYKHEANPDLQSESSNSIELGLRGDNAAGSFEVTGFFNRYENFIESVTDTTVPGYSDGVSQYKNVGEAEIKGIELRGQLLLDVVTSAPEGTSLKGSIAYADGKNRDTGEKLNSVAPLTAVFGLAYDDISEDWGGELAWTLVKGKDDSDVSNDSVAEGSTQFNPGGYGLVDLTAYYLPAEDVTLRAGLFNITDKKYYEWNDIRGLQEGREGLDRYTQPGRNFSVSVKWDI